MLNDYNNVKKTIWKCGRILLTASRNQSTVPIVVVLRIRNRCRGIDGYGLRDDISRAIWDVGHRHLTGRQRSVVHRSHGDRIRRRNVRRQRLGRMYRHLDDSRFLLFINKYRHLKRHQQRCLVTYLAVIDGDDGVQQSKRSLAVRSVYPRRWYRGDRHSAARHTSRIRTCTAPLIRHHNVAGRCWRGSGRSGGVGRGHDVDLLRRAEPCHALVQTAHWTTCQKKYSLQ